MLAIEGGGQTGPGGLGDGGPSFLADESPPLEAAGRIEDTCRTWGQSLAILWERYDIRTKLPQTHAYDAIGINFTARWMAARYHCQILTPAQQHTPSTAERHELEAIGYWVKGKNDAQSAAWHLLHYLRQSGNLPPRERAILSEAVRTMGTQA